VKERVVILGGGGHAKVVADILEEMGRFEIAGYIAPEASAKGLFGYRWLGRDVDVLQYAGSTFVAIGDNRSRLNSIEGLKRRGARLINAVHPSAVVSKHAELGEGIAIMAGAVINACTRVGDGAIINTNASVDHDCGIGACAHIAPGVTLAGHVTVAEGVFLGAGSAVIPGVTIGPWTTVGAGSVVVDDLPGSVLAFGVPAKIRRQNHA
jgi:UDP-perosamine 4-acetyltransferase